MIRHSRVSEQSDDIDRPELIQPSDWNDDHVLDDPAGLRAALELGTAAQSDTSDFLSGSSELDDLANVDVPSPANNEALVFNSGSGKWEPAGPFIPTSQEGVASGVATLGTDGLVEPDQLPPATIAQAQGTYLESGGGVAYLQDYDFAVSPAVYIIAGVRHISPLTTVTLDPSDGTYDRFDAIIVDDTGAASAITGTPSANPELPDVDPLTQLALTYVLVVALSTAPAITQTDIYKEDAEWTSSVSGGTINAASASLPFAGTKCIEATAAVNGNYVRLTNGATISLASSKQLVFMLRSKAAWPNQKSLRLTWYNGTTKIGQSVAVARGRYGFVDSNTTDYQQIVIPIGDFAVPASSEVDRLEVLVHGSGGSIGWRIDNIILEEGSTDVVPISVSVASTTVSGTVKTDVNQTDPVVYTKTSVDTLLANAGSARATVTKTTASLADDATETGTVALAKAGLLLQVTVDRACWVRLYQTSADRTADASRLFGEPAPPSTDILEEFAFAGAGTRRRIVVGYCNGDGSPTTAIYYAITNKSGAAHTVQVDFLHLKLEV